jgi:hypothetical protein
MARLAPHKMAESTPAPCANCGAPPTGAYCAKCGQKPARRDPTFGEFLRDTTHELTDWDGKLPATLRALFFRPGLLTEDFLAGRRARWLPPLRVYLICSLVFFASRPLIEAATGRALPGIVTVTATDESGNVSLAALRRAAREGFPAKIFGADRLERAVADLGRLNREIYAALEKAAFVLLPVFALLTTVAWRRRQRRYPAHLYVALHIHAAVFCALAVSRLAGFIPSRALASIAGMLFLAYAVWYIFAALHRIFGESWPKTIAKGLAIGIVYVACLNLVSLAALSYALTKM